MMKMTFFNLLILSFFISFSSLIQAQYCIFDNRFTEKAYFNSSQIDSVFNVTYGNAQTWDNQSQDLKFDIYYPKDSEDNLSKRPVIVLMHGGSFLIGDKSDWRLVTREFAKRGYVAITINYRLGYDANNNTGLLKAIYRGNQDLNACLRYITNHANQYQIDNSWLFIGGGSAGAFTCLNSIYLTQTEWNIAFPGVQSLLGSLYTNGNNLTDTYNVKGIFNNWGMTVGAFIEQSEMLPMISFHGELDDVVEIDVSSTGQYGSRKIHQELIASSVCSDLTVQSNGGHGIFVDYSGSVFRVNRASCFFKSVFCSSCSEFYSTDYIEANCSETQSIDEFKESKIKIFPNPTSDIIQISSDLQIEKMELFDLAGQNISIKSKNNEINLHNLEEGFYFLKLSGTDNKIYTFKILKK